MPKKSITPRELAELKARKRDDVSDAIKVLRELLRYPAARHYTDEIFDCIHEAKSHLEQARKLMTKRLW